MTPEFLRYNLIQKPVIMYTVGIGMIPYNDTDNDDYHLSILTLDICSGLRPKISINIPRKIRC
jgi:hypothetical protein